MCEIVLRPRAYVVPFINVVAFESERDIYNFFCGKCYSKYAHPLTDDIHSLETSFGDLHL